MRFHRHCHHSPWCSLSWVRARIFRNYCPYSVQTASSRFILQLWLRDWIMAGGCWYLRRTWGGCFSEPPLSAPKVLKRARELALVEVGPKHLQHGGSSAQQRITYPTQPAHPRNTGQERVHIPRSCKSQSRRIATAENWRVDAPPRS